MKKYKNLLEQLNAEFCEIPFIKKYPVLRTTKLTPIQINLIELVVSFESNKQRFQMAYSNIAYRIGCSTDSIRPNVSALKKMGLIDTERVYKKNVGGSKTFLSVKMDALATYIRSFHQEQSSQQVSQNRESTEPTPELGKDVQVTSRMLEVVTSTPLLNTDMTAFVPTLFFDGDKKKTKPVGTTKPEAKNEAPIQQAPPKRLKPKKVLEKMKFDDVPLKTFKPMSTYLMNRLGETKFAYDLDEMCAETGQEEEDIKKFLTYFKEQLLINLNKEEGKWFVSINLSNCKAKLGWSTPKAA